MRAPLLLTLVLVSAPLTASAADSAPAASAATAPAPAASADPAPAPSPTLGQMLASTSQRGASFETQPASDGKASKVPPVTLAPAMSSKAKKTWIIVGSVLGAAAIAAAVSGGGGGNGSSGGIY